MSILEFLIATFVLLISFLVVLQISLMVNAWQMASYAAFMSARSMLVSDPPLRALAPNVDWDGPHARTGKNVMAQSYPGSNYEAKVIFYSAVAGGGVLVYWEMPVFLPPPLGTPFDLMDPDDFIPAWISSLIPFIPAPATDGRTMVVGHSPMPMGGRFWPSGCNQPDFSRAQVICNVRIGPGIPTHEEKWDSAWNDNR